MAGMRVARIDEGRGEFALIVTSKKVKNQIKSKHELTTFAAARVTCGCGGEIGMRNMSPVGPITFRVFYIKYCSMVKNQTNT